MKIFINGLDELSNVIREEVSWMFSDVEEIGSSDVSICANNVLGLYYDHPSEATDSEFKIVRAAVHTEIGELLA